MNEAAYILNLLKQGEKKGLQLLFKKYYRPLVLYALKFVRRQDIAEDIVQEVFIKFWEKKSFIAVDQHLRSYLYQAVHNHCLNSLEKNENRRITSIPDYGEWAEEEHLDDSEWNQKLEEIYREIRKLPPRTQEIFLAVLFKNKKYKEVAEELHISVNTVKTTIARAMITLKNNLKKKTYLFLLFIAKNL